MAADGPQFLGHTVQFLGSLAGNRRDLIVGYQTKRSDGLHEADERVALPARLDHHVAGQEQPYAGLHRQRAQR